MGQKFTKSSGAAPTSTADGVDTSAHDKALKAATGGRWGRDTGLARKSPQVQAALASAAEPEAVEAKAKHEEAKLAAQGGRWGEAQAPAEVPEPSPEFKEEREKVREVRSQATGGRW